VIVDQLPDLWVMTTLGEISDLKGGLSKGKKRRQQIVTRFVPYLRVANVQKGFLRLDEMLSIDATEEEISALALVSGDVLFNEGGDRDKLGRGWVWEGQIPECIHQNHVFRARVNQKAVNPFFLSRWGNSQEASQFFLDEGKQTTNLASISLTKLSSLPVPLAPHVEQRRIVAKLDALQSRTCIAREALDVVAPLLKSFRQSVLQAAVTGALTEEWRSKQRKLPEWDSILISDAGKIQLGRQRSPKYHSGDNMRPYLRVQNVFEDRLDLSDVMTMEFSAEDFERYRLVPGDILLNEGQSPELLGRPAMYRGELEGACFTNTLIRFQAYPNVVSEYALLVFRYYMHSGKFRQEGTITTNIAHLGAGRFSSLDFPLPPLAEQTEIVRRVRHLFAMADAMEAEFAAAQRSVDQLDQSLLATAFRGELVPQDPSDEPASVLFERIRAARAAAPETKGKRGRKASSGFDASLLMAAEPVAPKKRGRPPKR
jgi:type I restriction enzyme, S subunit